ncbi:MAG: hypothetical protein FWF08_04545 [Oscillospiraceae bacterium]|nr:hypothetical protein [Oscillospiraceae bacterium]
MIKKHRLLPALALALIMCLACLTTAFAAQPSGTETDPAQAAITKLLKVPFGTAVPTAAFKFKVTPISIDGDTNAKPPVAGIGSNGDVYINFPALGTPPAYTFKETIGDTDYYFLESAELFGGVSFANAGVYKYEIEELGSDFTNVGTPPTAPYEEMSYSGAKYEVEVYVKDGINGRYIYFIGSVRTTEEDGTPGTDKVDPTPGSESEDFDYSQMIFTNTYVKANGGTDPKDPDNWTLSVSKDVLGEFASQTIYFAYNMKVFTPSLIGAAETYKAYVVEADPDPENAGKYKVVTSAANGTVSGTDLNGGYINFPSDTLTAFNLKAGQFLVFIDTPVGTSYEITETGTAGYIPSAIVTYAGAAGGNEVGSKGASLVLPHSANDFYKTTLYVGEGLNSADFINENDTTTPTGLDLNDLPFIGMILLAVGAGAAFIVIKYRKKKSYN